MSSPSATPPPNSPEPPKSLRQEVVSSTRWAAADKWGSRVMQLLVFAILARLLDPRDFGLVALASAIIAFTQPLVDQGMSKALIQRKELTKGHCNAAFWTSVGLASLLAAVIALLARPISVAFGDADLTNVLRWLALSLPIYAIQATPAALMQRTFRYRSLTIRQLIGATAGGIAGVITAFAGGGVWSLVVQAVFGAAVSSAVLWRLEDWRPSLSFTRQEFKDLWSFGINVVGIEAIAIINGQADRFIVGAGLGLKELGYYHIGLRIVSIVTETATAIISQVALPAFARLQADLPRLRRAYMTATRVSVSFAIPLFAFLAVAAPEVIALAFGPGWGPSVPVMQAFAGLGAINAAVYFDRNVLYAVDKARLALYITVFQTVVNVGLALVTVKYGIVWTAIGVTARQYLIWPLRLYILKRTIHLSILQYLKPWVIALGCSAVMCAAVYGLRQLLPGFPEAPYVIAAAIVAGVTYAVALRAVAGATVREAIGLVRG